MGCSWEILHGDTRTVMPLCKAGNSQLEEVLVKGLWTTLEGRTRSNSSTDGTSSHSARWEPVPLAGPFHFRCPHWVHPTQGCLLWSLCWALWHRDRLALWGQKRVTPNPLALSTDWSVLCLIVKDKEMHTVYARNSSELLFQQPCGMKVSFSHILAKLLVFWICCYRWEIVPYCILDLTAVLDSASVSGFYFPLTFLVSMLQRLQFFSIWEDWKSWAHQRTAQPGWSGLSSWFFSSWSTWFCFSGTNDSAFIRNFKDREDMNLWDYIFSCMSQFKYIVGNLRKAESGQRVCRIGCLGKGVRKDKRKVNVPWIFS